MTAPDLASDLHTAIADVLDRHGYGLLSRMILVAEIVDEDGALGLLLGSSPTDLPVWDRVGMLRYALHDTEADVIASRITQDEE
ncbi:hypothetical protein GCM10020367_20890 [Streptomyces sannanensis]|uniref:Uncharacterized protein n=1 Tax=Streptomyces sannanensis TaxID=285536 RepID=A0ABP6S9T9_9ACTN